MCLAIFNAAGVLLDKDVFEKAHRSNRDGMGLVIAIGGKLVIEKEMKDVDAFYARYKDLRETHPESKIVIHFRLSTQGAVSLENAHPFLVDKDLAFVHNGIINGMGFKGTLSDTMIYNERILQKLPKGFIKNKAILKLLMAYTGSYNKFIFLDSKNEAMIININAGTQDKEGNWFSNTHWKYEVYNGYQKHSQHVGDAWSYANGRWVLKEDKTGKPYQCTIHDLRDF